MNVRVYSLSTCGHCRSVKKLLDEHSIEHECVYADKLKGDERKEVLNEVRRLNPRCSFPTISIDNKVIVGYKELKIKEALGLA